LGISVENVGEDEELWFPSSKVGQKKFSVHYADLLSRALFHVLGWFSKKILLLQNF
jgi:hypothetical protein